MRNLDPFSGIVIVVMSCLAFWLVVLLIYML